MVLSLLIVFGSLPLLTAAGGGGARSEHQRIVDFWTHARVAQAQPRDFVFDPTTHQYRPAAGKPGGSGVVSGSSWTKGGAIDGSEGKVLFQMDGSYWVCSATVVTDSANGRSIVLTAAHCVYDEVNHAFATNWTFIPDYDAAPAPLSTSSTAYCNDTLYGCWTAAALTVHNGYATAGGFNDQAVLYDWGFAALGNGGKTGTLVEDVLDNAYDGPGTQAIVFAPQSFGFTGHAFGYPAAQRYKGNDLTYCKGTVDGDPYNSDDTYRFNGCKMTGGSSGGGMLFGFNETTGYGTLFSNNSYGYSGVSAMHGPFFNANTLATYNAALSGGNDVVGD
ncbi:MAG: hypothetical protein A2146_07670 [Actinobacteria bacterium RBG_16_67_10]|nr:MAG: hypothetical protein A2146_07670 [Actinobacteria bacterium RBG_16_67_10]